MLNLAQEVIKRRTNWNRKDVNEAWLGCQQLFAGKNAVPRTLVVFLKACGFSFVVLLVAGTINLFKKPSG